MNTKESKEACPAGVTYRPALDWFLNRVNAIRADVFKEIRKNIGFERESTLFNSLLVRM